MRVVSEATSSLMGGDEQWPPGFRFHPTDEELVLYYLKRKICGLRLKLDAIAEVDVYKADPEDLPPLSKLKTGDRQWFFFSPRDRKYPSGGRSNRATKLGYWKATGKDRSVTCNSRSVGIKKTLVFYRGRAPSGERTDWVMHEYTIDEEELKRSPVQDYYALYKIYKKSGPGPKNGEQYGAPFREEDWADDDKAIDSVGQQHDVSFDSVGTNCQPQSQLNGLDVLLNRAINDPLFEPISEPCGTETTLVERNLQERAIVLPSCGQLNGAQSCFNSTQLKSTQFREISEVTCANNVIRQGSQESDKDFIEDFLEIDDLFGPEPTQQNTVNHVDLRIEDFDGLCELDLFENGFMFLQDIDNTEPSFYTYNNNVMNEICNPVPASCPNNFDNGVVNQVSNSYFNNYPSEMVQPISQPHDTFVDNETVNQFNYEIPHGNDVADQRWMPTPIAPNQGSVIPPTSGVVSGGLNQNQSHNHNQTLNQNGEVIEGEESWLSSSLWSFLETIPTTPASATESTALVSNAFERLSSFGKMGDNVKIGLLGRNATAGDPNATHRRYRYWYSRGVMFFSVLVLLFAIVWVFTETSVSVLVSL